MILRVILLIGLLLSGAGTLCAQLQILTSIPTEAGDSADVWVQIPHNYDPLHPPPLLIWWHQLGGTRLEMRNYSQFDEAADARNWIAATFAGPNDRHWNTRIPQLHCKAVMDYIATLYPFCRDSIYMIGGSMGGAAGQVWHNNNCGVHDYLIAATAGASQIMDTELRQEQYLATGDTNRSMRTAFGGLPSESERVAFEYHRYSAIFMADTAQSMHTNSLHLPVWSTWGIQPEETLAYGMVAQFWDSVRIALGADSTVCGMSDLSGHGLGIMPVDSICNWLSGFRANYFPDQLTITADESDEYYWTQVTLADTSGIFGRYGVVKNPSARRIDFTLLRNISALEVECLFPWTSWDTLRGTWLNLDTERVPYVTVRFSHLPEVRSVQLDGSIDVPFTFSDGTLQIGMAEGGEYTVIFYPNPTDEPPAPVPAALRLVAAYPNPFNSQVSLEIEASHIGQQELRLYDITGRLAKTLSVGLQPGVQRITLPADGLASGIYFIRLTGSQGHPLKLALLR